MSKYKNLIRKTKRTKHQTRRITLLWQTIVEIEKQKKNIAVDVKRKLDIN